MNVRTWGLLALLPALLPMAGCVTLPAYVPLDAGVQTSLREVRVVSAIPQDEIFLSAASPGVVQAAGGGLLAAVVEAQIARVRQDEIQAVIEPFYAVVDDVDFRKIYWEGVLPELRKLHAGQTLDVKTTAAVLTLAERNSAIAALPAGKAFMYVGTSYGFTPDFARLNVVTGIDLWRGGQAEPVYSNVVHYQSASVGGAGPEAIALWSKDGGSRYRALIAEAVAETARMLRLDAEHPRVKGVDQKLPAGTRTLEARKAGPYGPDVNGPVLAEQPQRVVVRNTDGRLHSLPR
jgi:hypothetical protein